MQNLHREVLVEAAAPQVGHDDPELLRAAVLRRLPEDAAHGAHQKFAVVLIKPLIQHHFILLLPTRLPALLLRLNEHGPHPLLVMAHIEAAHLADREMLEARIWLLGEPRRHQRRRLKLIYILLVVSCEDAPPLLELLCPRRQLWLHPKGIIDHAALQNRDARSRLIVLGRVWEDPAGIPEPLASTPVAAWLYLATAYLLLQSARLQPNNFSAEISKLGLLINVLLAGFVDRIDVGHGVRGEGGILLRLRLTAAQRSWHRARPRPPHPTGKSPALAAFAALRSHPRCALSPPASSATGAAARADGRAPLGSQRHLRLLVMGVQQRHLRGRAR
mmetsp:Transcript_819/g.1868  ORF Transcript_819/g.1868 Transcript_819/m.1868 type:complete len:332 (+) Transcript_819:1265-2260(+)